MLIHECEKRKNLLGFHVQIHNIVEEFREVNVIEETEASSGKMKQATCI